MATNHPFGLASRRAQPLAWRLAWSAALLLATAYPAGVAAQLSSAALRFYGTGVGPPGQQDRILLPLDDLVYLTRSELGFSKRGIVLPQAVVGSDSFYLYVGRTF